MRTFIRSKFFIINGLTLLFILAIIGCKSEDKAEVVTEKQARITVPSLQMGVPPSLMGNSGTSPSILLSSNKSPAKSVDQGGCPALSDGADPFKNGYAITKFLVVLAENQACWAGKFMEAAVSLSPWVNQGPKAINDGGNVTQVQLDQTAGTYQFWVWFKNNPTPAFYITWTGSTSTDARGQFINKFWTADNDPSNDELAAVRFDFDHSISQPSNKVFIKFSDSTADNPNNIEGFRSEVIKNGSGATATFEANGLLSFSKQFNPGLPSDIAFNKPSLSMVTISDAQGLGASIAEFQNVALYFEDPAVWRLGPFEFTLTDKVYFNELAVETWKYKDITSATYKKAATDRYGTAQIDSIESFLGLDADYFTNSAKCPDTDGVTCTDFMKKVYEIGWSGTQHNDATTDEPNASDFRRAFFNTSPVQLSTVWPDNHSTYLVADFAIPSP